MNNENTNNAAIDMARLMNYRMHAKQLKVPVLNNLKIVNVDNPQTVLLATGGAFVEQLVSDGHIEVDEFDKRIELEIEKTKNFMRNSNYENVDNSFIKYKDYNNGIFDFKMYIQDMIMKVKDEKKVIRTIMAFFVEPKMHDFYQFSLSVGPFPMPTEHLKIGIIDLENDQVTKTIDGAMKNLLDNLKYNN